MHIIDIPDRNIKLQLPSCWEDCSIEQVQYIVQLAFDVINGRLSIGEFRIRIFVYLTKIKFGLKYLIRRKLGLNSLIDERIYHLSQQLCDWVFRKNEEDVYELNYQTIVNFFPVLSEKYYGPESLLADLTFGEFKSALTVLDQYFENKSNQEEAMPYLDFFIATLYREKDDKGNRLPFHNYVVKPNYFEEVPLWRKQAIAIWFSYCVKCLQGEDLMINGIDVNFSALFPKDNVGVRNNQKTNLGWTGVLMDIAESGVFGDAVSTSQSLLYDILLFLLKKHEDKPKEK